MSLEFLISTLPPWKREIHLVLEDWFNALEDGSAFSRLPDPAYKRPDDKPMWTDEQLDNLVCDAIDAYVDHQRSWIELNRHIKTDTHCGFQRLDAPQRLAFAQDLERVMVRFDVATGDTPAPPNDYSMYASMD